MYLVFLDKETGRIVNIFINTSRYTACSCRLRVVHTYVCTYIHTYTCVEGIYIPRTGAFSCYVHPLFVKNTKYYDEIFKTEKQTDQTNKFYTTLCFYTSLKMIIIFYSVVVHVLEFEDEEEVVDDDLVSQLCSVLVLVSSLDVLFFLDSTGEPPSQLSHISY